MLWALITTEYFKIRKTRILSLLFISPVFAGVVGFATSDLLSGSKWLASLLAMSVTHSLLLLPLIIGVLASFICRYEHLHGGWKQLLSLPVRREHVYLAKFIMIAVLIAVNQLLFGISWILVGAVKGFTDPIPLEALWKSLAGGWISTLPLAALLLFVSMAWSSFAAPLALNVVFTLPNILVANSKQYAPYYPWVQPFLTMLPKGDGPWGGFFTSFESLIFAICGSLLLFFAAGLLYIRQKAI
ncbi:ABC transporter permease [Ectobacillus funiculus]|jgi:hypothetical protein|uniref:ABC transporter permease n=1 Tax=Ectobacillus funiculus TaxID=137993 RepID=A0ABV5WKR7_9BACI